VAFELGATLRQAREARQLAFEEVAAETRIHPRYLAALEAERFDILPGRAYARSFLQEYAQYLGLDASTFVAEYDDRFVDASVAPQPLVAVHRRKKERSFKGGVVLGMTLIAVAVAVLAWKFGGASPTSPAAHTPAAHAARTPVRKVVAVAPEKTPAPKLLVVSASGRCWVPVRAGSANGAVVYEGTLEPGQSQRFAQRPLWIRFGAPWNVNVRLDGKAVALPDTTGPVNMQFSATAQRA
jgi:transcriptional regulator with XRE-family HTH domain